VHLAVLAAFVQTGQALGRGELERLARAGGADPAALLAELAERDVTAFGQTGEIRRLPLLPPYPIQVSWEDAWSPTPCAPSSVGHFGDARPAGYGHRR
jgi:hypothetical protein